MFPATMEMFASSEVFREVGYQFSDRQKQITISTGLTRQYSISSSKSLSQYMISLLPAIPQMRYKFIYGWITFKNINTFLYSLFHLIRTPFLPIYFVALSEVSELHCLVLVCQLISLAVQGMFSQGCLSPQCTRISSRIVLLLLL